MELDELNKLIELNELDLLYKISDIVESNKSDVIRVLKDEKAAGIRMRNSLQDIRTLCEIIRDKIQIRKGIEWNKRKSSALEKAIKEAEAKQAKDKILIEKRKQARIDRIRR